MTARMGSADKSSMIKALAIGKFTAWPVDVIFGSICDAICDAISRDVGEGCHGEG